MTDAERIELVARIVMGWSRDHGKVWLFAPDENDVDSCLLLDRLAELYGGFVTLAAIANGWNCRCLGGSGVSHEGITPASRRRAILLCACAAAEARETEQTP